MVGGYNKTKIMATSLLEQKYQVTVISADYSDCLKLAQIKDITVIHGDGTKPYILDEANADTCDIAIALTNKDADNLVICQLCKKRYGVKKTAALINDPYKIDFFHQMGVDSVTCALDIMTSIIQQQVFKEDIMNIIPMIHENIKIIDMQITKSSKIASKQLRDVALPKEMIVGCILRGGDIVIPRGDTHILVGDILIMIAGQELELNTIHTLIE